MIIVSGRFTTTIPRKYLLQSKRQPKVSPAGDQLWSVRGCRGRRLAGASIQSILEGGAALPTASANLKDKIKTEIRTGTKTNAKTI